MIAVHHSRPKRQEIVPAEAMRCARDARPISALNLIVEPGEVAYSTLQQLVHVS